MNVFDIEVLRQNLLVELPVTYGKSRVFLFYNFYSSLLNSSDKALIEAYSLEFIEEYINSVKNYSPFCLPPERTAGLVKQLNEITSLISTENFKLQIIKKIERIEVQLTELESILFGNKKDEQNLKKLSFPLIEENTVNMKSVYGFLETVRISINKSKDGNKLYVFPNKGELEKNLEKQIKDSFLLAIKWLKNHKRKFNNYHEITVYFDNFSANYIGNSLGIALAVGFIERLTKLYNLPFLVNIKNNIASTGGINKEGNILPVEKEFIEKKVEIVFYSSIEIFIIPQKDEPFAIEKLNELKDLYPQRNLRIIGVTNLEDILDRRNLINILKQNPIIRSVKASIRNWQVTMLIFVLYIIIAITLFRNFDENPAILENQGKILLVKNKSGRVLWTKNVNYEPLLLGTKTNLKQTQIIVDIDNDGTNEVILTAESNDRLKNPNDYGRVACFNSDGNIIWSYIYRDSVSASGGSLTPFYTTSLIDTFSLNNNKFLLAFASNTSSSCSIIFALNLENGKRKGGILKHNGLISDAFIYDFNKDGIKEVAFTAINNEYGKAAFGAINLTDLSGRCPSKNYQYAESLPDAHFNSYIMLPKINYYKQEDFVNPQIKLGAVTNNPAERCIYLNSVEEAENTASFLNFKIHYDWQKIDIVAGNRFNDQIDSSIASGNLIPYYQENRELTQLLSKDVMYWNGKDFVKKNK